MNKIIAILITTMIMSFGFSQVPPKDAAMNTKLQEEKSKAALIKKIEEEKEAKLKAENTLHVYTQIRVEIGDDGEIKNIKKSEVTNLKTDSKEQYVAVMEQQSMAQKQYESNKTLPDLINSLGAAGLELATHSFAFTQYGEEVHYLTFEMAVNMAE